MAITKKSSNYRQIINKLNFLTDKTNDGIKKLSRNETIRIINFYGTHMTLIITVIISVNSQVPLFILGVLGMPVGALISIFFREKANSLRSILDNEIFNNFLIKKIQIFYPQDDKTNFKYTQIKQISVKTFHTTNEHQAIIELAYKAYKEKSTGIIITDSNSSNIVTSAINNKAGATAITKTVYTASAMLIKDITKTPNKQFDLEYWYELFKKNAISEDEYNQKKEYLLKNQEQPA